MVIELNIIGLGDFRLLYEFMMTGLRRFWFWNYLCFVIWYYYYIGLRTGECMRYLVYATLPFFLYNKKPCYYVCILQHYVGCGVFHEYFTSTVNHRHLSNNNICYAYALQAYKLSVVDHSTRRAPLPPEMRN